MSMELNILSPEKGILSGRAVDRVELPGAKGRFVVLKDHAPIISSLVGGVISFSSPEGDGSVEISSGFARVKDNVVTACVELPKAVK